MAMFSRPMFSRPLFSRPEYPRASVLDPVDPGAPLEAYKEGRRDERRTMESGVLDHRLVKKELDEAYDRGLRQGRLERRGSWTGMLALLVLAALLIGAAYMVVQYGSFAAAGAAIDGLLA